MRRDILRERLWPSGVIFVSLLAFWLILSGHFDALHITYGVISAGLVVVLTRGVERLGTRVDADGRAVPVFTFSLSWPRFLAYLPWLLGQIILANLQLAAVILHRRLPISPTVVRLRTRLHGDLARTTFGNSITLTPGTITLDMDGDELVVHALTRDAARALLTRTMERRVARALGEA